MSQDIVLEGIINFPTVFEPQQIDGKGEPKYSCTLILDPRTDWNAVQACVNEAIVAKFGNQIPSDLKMPFTLTEQPEFQGRYEIHAYGYSNRPIQVVDANVNPILDRSMVFSGCKAQMYVRFRAYNTSGNRGVGVDFYALQIVDNVNVKRLDNAKDAKDVFKAVPGAPAPLSQPAFAKPQQAPGPFPTGAPPQQAPGPFAQPGQNAAAPGPAFPSSGPVMPWQQ